MIAFAEKAQCNKVISCRKSTTSTTKTHLRALHPEILNELILLEQEVQSQRDLLSDQRKLNEKKAEKYPLQSQIQLQWDMNILQLLVETELPFTLVEHPGFRKFINKVDPKVTVKSANTFAQQKLPLMTRTIKDTMNQVSERDLQQCTAVAMTADHWTSRTGTNYMSITLQYVKPDFTLKNFIIQLDQFDGRHTGINIAQAWDKKLDSISASKNIPKVTAVVDQATNMGLALTLSKRVRTLEEGSMQCIDHKLNTALQKSSEAK